MNREDAISELNHRFGIPGIAQVVAGSGGMAKVCIASAAASGEMYLHGAHVTSWRPRDAEEVLFLSARSRWEDGIAIRGGIPISFPWFAGNADMPSAPAHGFVRTKAWQLDSIERIGDATTVSMVTASDVNTKQWCPADFQLTYRATFGESLVLELIVENTGTVSFRFEEALHAYFLSGSIEKTRLHGLDSVEYVDKMVGDKMDAARKKTQHGPIAIVSATDSVYLNTKADIEIEDSVLRRRVRVANENSLTTVVWNPWLEKAKAMSDLGDDEWMQMICIETSNVSDFAVELAPMQRHSMKAVVSVAVL